MSQHFNNPVLEQVRQLTIGPKRHLVDEALWLLVDDHEEREVTLLNAAIHHFAHNDPQISVHQASDMVMELQKMHPGVLTLGESHGE